MSSPQSAPLETDRAVEQQLSPATSQEHAAIADELVRDAVALPPLEVRRSLFLKCLSGPADAIESLGLS